MNILNRYVLKKFLRPFVASFSALCIIIFVSQLFERLDRFMADGVNWGHVLGYLLTSMPFQAIQILPVACLLGTLFVIGDLARNREYIAALAGGVPPEKFMGGILAAGLVISLFSLVINETVVPPTSRYATRVFREKIRRLSDWQPSVAYDLFVAGAEGRMWSIKQFDRDQNLMSRVIVDTYHPNQLESQIDAKSALWKIDGWTFKDGLIRIFKRDSKDIETVEKFTEKTFPYVEKPSDFTTQEIEAEEMSSKALRKQMDRLESLGVPIRKLQVEYRMKLALPLACFVVTFLGIPLALKGRGSRAMGITAAAVLSLTYLGFVQFGKAMAQRLIPPLFGAWLANLVFIGIGIYLWMRMRRQV